MHNTKIIKLLKSLDQYEITQFKDFVNSPSFNKNKNVTKLFDELKKSYPKFNAEDIGEEIVFKKVFPKEKYNYFKLKNTASDLFALSKEFLSYTAFKKNNKVKEQLLLAELRTRDLDNIFEQTLKAAVKQNEASEVRDENYFYHKLLLTEELSSYYAPKEPDEHPYFLQERLDLFIRFALIRIVKFYNVMLHEETQHNFKYDPGLFDEIMKYINNNNFEHIPTLMVYNNIILLETKLDDKYFFELKSLAEKHRDQLSLVDRYMIFLHMSGYCAYNFNINSRTDLLAEHFKLINEKNAFWVNEFGKILYPDFINEVKISVRVNNFEWAENYIEINKHKLESEKESTLNFCYGMIQYKKGNPAGALDFLTKTYFPIFILKLQVKILQLQIYFETEYFDQAISMIDSFRHYLKRETTIKEDFKVSFYEFLRITNDLIKLKTDHANDRYFQIEKLKAEIKNVKNNQFGVKIWLNEKIKDCK